MSRQALLLCRPDHPNVEALSRELPRAGLQPVVLDPRTFPRSSTLSLRLAAEGKLSIDLDEGRGTIDEGRRTKGPPPSSIVPRPTSIVLSEVRVGWFSSQDRLRLVPHTAPSARRFARAASVAALVSLRHALDVPWVNDPWRAAKAGDKLWQLVVAKRRGLATPDTLVTNDPRAFSRFVREKKAAAVKSPSGSTGLSDDAFVLTQRITPADLRDGGADGIRLAPVIAQEYVEKATELRVTVVGSRVFACEIHSQESAKTRVDWRRYDPSVRMTRAQLPTAVAKRCVQVVKDLGLDYSGVDLIRTPKDEHVFLEANSEPAWLWVEDATGMPITRALATLLARRAQTR